MIRPDYSTPSKRRSAVTYLGVDDFRIDEAASKPFIEVRFVPLTSTSPADTAELILIDEDGFVFLWTVGAGSRIAW